MKYKVGDKVKVRADLSECRSYYMANGITCDDAVTEMLAFKGKTVTIASITGLGKYRIKEDPAWNWTDEMFAGPACEQKIVITSDGVTTLARLYEGSKVVKSAEAKCSPDDEFKFETGAKLAMERLYAPEHKFKIGDRVKHHTNGVGTIIFYDKIDHTYAVEFDKAFPGGHICNGRTKHGCGWWCFENKLEAYTDPKFKKGDWVRIIGKPTIGEGGVIHNYDIGDVVKIHGVDSDGSYYCKRPYDKLEQYVSAKDVESPKK